MRIFIYFFTIIFLFFNNKIFSEEIKIIELHNKSIDQALVLSESKKSDNVKIENDIEQGSIDNNNLENENIQIENLEDKESKDKEEKNVEEVDSNNIINENEIIAYPDFWEKADKNELLFLLENMSPSNSNVLNEAFLERFSITMEQEYPSNAIEKKILTKEFERLEITDQDEYVSNLVMWADVIRKSFFEGAIDELISTRRLVHIAQAFTMFKDKMKAIEMCVSRFDSETKATFLDLYTKVDEEAIEVPEEQEDDGEVEITFEDYNDPSNEEEAF